MSATKTPTPAMVSSATSDAATRAAKLRLLNFLSLFRDLQSRRDSAFSGGGGVVAEIFRDLQEPAWFSGGGG